MHQDFIIKRVFHTRLHLTFTWILLIYDNNGDETRLKAFKYHAVISKRRRDGLLDSLKWQKGISHFITKSANVRRRNSAELKAMAQ